VQGVSAWRPYCAYFVAYILESVVSVVLLTILTSSALYAADFLTTFALISVSVLAYSCACWTLAVMVSVVLPTSQSAMWGIGIILWVLAGIAYWSDVSKPWFVVLSALSPPQGLSLGMHSLMLRNWHKLVRVLDVTMLPLGVFLDSDTRSWPS
jgi:hypothetical protein